jgi:UDP-glucose 6-dehydrogenase
LFETNYSKQLLDEGATLTIYDPRVSYEQIVDDLKDPATDVHLITCENDERSINKQNAVLNIYNGNSSHQNLLMTSTGNGTKKSVSPSIHRRPRQMEDYNTKTTVEVACDAYEAAKGAHAIVVCTEWDEFK